MQNGHGPRLLSWRQLAGQGSGRLLGCLKAGLATYSMAVLYYLLLIFT